MKKLFCLAAWLAFLIPCGAHAQSKTEPRLRLLVPAYFYPAGDGLKSWDILIASANKAPIAVIVNPASGPGDKVDANYSKVVARGKQARLSLLGYISTSYGKRPIEAVKADVDKWLRFYTEVEGIFFDEQASGADLIPYYTALYLYARTQKRRKQVVTNPGTICASQYVSQPATDVACLFESKKGFEEFKPPAWAKSYPPSRFGALAYNVADAQRMRNFVQEAVRKRLGYVYFTDAAGDNPWDRLPRYWSQEVAFVREANK